MFSFFLLWWVYGERMRKMCYPQIHDYCTIWMDTMTHVTAKGSKEFGLTNTNKLIRQYEYATGLKTGSTGLAKFCEWQKNLSRLWKGIGMNV